VRPALQQAIVLVPLDFDRPADEVDMLVVSAAGRDSARELTVLADRERIAHDLHDHVIRRLSTTVMDLQGTIARAHSPVVADRLNCTLEDLQTTTEEIRTSIFALRCSNKPGKGFRHRIQQVIADLTENRHIVTAVQMQGSMTAVGAELAEHAQAVTAEAISNTVHHSGATNLTVKVPVNDELSIDIADDGRGMTADNQRHSGFANIQRHAEHWAAPARQLTTRRRHSCALDRTTGQDERGLRHRRPWINTPGIHRGTWQLVVSAGIR
jgi:signal transduction histidine kinase